MDDDLEEEDDLSQEDESMIDEPTSTGSETANGESIRKPPSRVHWKKVENQNSPYDIPVFQDSFVVDDTIQSPYYYFSQFLCDEILQDICFHCNLYAAQKDPAKSFNLTQLELQQWLGICMQMSITKINNTRLHWSSFAINEKIASLMSRKRWEDIKASIHLVDNSNLDSTDKLVKVRLLVDHLRNKFQKIPMEEHLSVDEQIVPFKGVSSLKQYIPKKPNKWGYKNFVLAGSSGMVYDFIPYIGKILPVDRPGVPDIGASGNSVLHLAECVPDQKYFKLYFDNWFTSLKLVEHLASRKIMSCGTVQQRRLKGLTFKSDKQLQKLDRGAFDEHEIQETENTITGLKWYDNRAVCFLSSFKNSYPVINCKRYDKKKKEYVQVPIPNMVSDYNSHMGGVDLHDQFISYYRMSFRSKKYYLRLVFHLIDMAVVNSWLLLRRVEKKKEISYHQLTSLCEFKLRLADILMKINQDLLRKRGRPSSESVQSEFSKKKHVGHATKSIPEADIRKDGIGHYPSHAEKRGTCKYPNCTGRIFMFCLKCKVHLCCDKNRNCFLAFHQN